MSNFTKSVVDFEAEATNQSALVNEEINAIERYKRSASFKHLPFLGRDNVEVGDIEKDTSFFTRKRLDLDCLPQCDKWKWNPSTKPKVKKVDSIWLKFAKFNARRKKNSDPLPKAKVWIFHAFSAELKTFLYSFFWCEISLCNDSPLNSANTCSPQYRPPEPRPIITSSSIITINSPRHNSRGSSTSPEKFGTLMLPPGKQPYKHSNSDWQTGAEKDETQVYTSHQWEAFCPTEIIKELTESGECSFIQEEACDSSVFIQKYILTGPDIEESLLPSLQNVEWVNLLE